MTILYYLKNELKLQFWVAAMGADGVSLHINIGGKEEPEMLEQLGMTANQCHKWGMPLLAIYD